MVSSDRLARCRVARRSQLIFNPRGLTLIEVLVALVATLILMGAVISVLGMVGTNVANSRSQIEVSNRLRSAQMQLRDDLAGATCPGMVWQRPEAGNGYLEIIEGPIRDAVVGSGPNYSPKPPESLEGDTDDMILLTTKSKGQPFVGKIGKAVFQSNIAEVMWFLVPAQQFAGGVQTYNLHRRIFLVLPNTPSVSIPATPNANDEVASRNNPAIPGNIPATLGDLTDRQWRVRPIFNIIRNQAFPHNLRIVPGKDANFALSGLREGEDIVLSNVLGMDVKVFDPTAQIKSGQADGTPVGLNPGDAGYKQGGTVVGTGAYVDLGDTTTGSTQFGLGMSLASKFTGSYATYDTWNFGYEQDGVDQYNDSIIDLGTDGLDNDNTNGVDDANERETSPPYPYPLRGIQVKIRVYEPSSKSIREVTIEETFVPE